MAANYDMTDSSAATAYSMIADTPPNTSPYEGTRLPIFRETKISPRTRLRDHSGSILESAHVMNSACGFGLRAPIAGTWLFASDRLRVESAARRQSGVLAIDRFHWQHIFSVPRTPRRPAKVKMVAWGVETQKDSAGPGVEQTAAHHVPRQ